MVFDKFCHILFKLSSINILQTLGDALIHHPFYVKPAVQMVNLVIFVKRGFANLCLGKKPTSVKMHLYKKYYGVHGENHWQVPFGFVNSQHRRFISLEDGIETCQNACFSI